MSELYKWCPSCNKEEVTNEKEPELLYAGGDGYGQYVKFSKCDCGKDYGWFNIGFYRNVSENFTMDDGFKFYLKHRIEYYHKG